MGIAERRERERLQRRQLILEAARRVFFRCGFRQATMEQIAQEAELGKATLYDYFGSKEELYVALLEEGLRLLDAHMEQVEQHYRTRPVREAIHAMAQAYVRFAQEQPEYFVLLMHVSTALELPLERVPQELLQRLHALQEQAVLRGTTLVLRGIREGIFPEWSVPERVIAQFWVILTGAIALARHPYRMRLLEGVSVEELVRELVELFICGWQWQSERS